MSKVIRGIESIIYIFALLILAFLFLQSLLTTVRITPYNSEINYFIDGNPVLIVFIAIFILVILYILTRYITLSDTLLKSLIVIIAILNLFFVLMAFNSPKADMHECVRIAAQLVEGNPESFDIGQYMYIYPNQNGIVLFYYFVMKIFGVRNYLAIQIINVLAVTLGYFFIFYFWKKYRPEELKIVLIGILFFFPITLYTTVCYGTLIGVVCAGTSLIWQQIYFKERKYRYLAASAILIALAVQLKSNYLIFLIGILLGYLFDFIVEKKRKSLLCLIITLCIVILGNFGVKTTLNQLTDGFSAKIKGAPMLSFMVMGLQESPMAPGWHNGYDLEIFYSNNWDYDATAEVCFSDFKEEVKQKLRDPLKSIKFFSKKIASQWCEPAYQGFWYNREEYDTGLQMRSNLYYDMITVTGKINRIFYLFLDAFQSLLYLGGLLYLVFHKQTKLTNITGIIIFIGGFIFHLFWEAKSSYVFPYAIILIPYAMTGYMLIFDLLKNLKFQKKAFKFQKQKIIILVISGLIIVAFWNVFKIDQDTKTWDDYINSYVFIPTGKYLIMPKNTNSKCLALNIDTPLQNLQGYDNNLLIEFDYDGFWFYQIYDTKNETYLSVQADEHNIQVWAGENINEDKQKLRWAIEKAYDEGYHIRWCQDRTKVLTYDSDKHIIYLDDYQEHNSSQIWDILQKDPSNP